MDRGSILSVFPFLASFPNAANRFLLKRSACGKISGPPKSPRVQIPKFHLTAFEDSSLSVTESVERSVLRCLHRAGVMCRHSFVVPDELIFVW